MEQPPCGLPPAPAQVRRQLERLLASPQLAQAPALGALLRYVVERTLQGEADRLKEYTLGVEVFDRGADFDPRVDTIVRVQGRRLRAKLDEYYRGPGRGDPVRIDLPKGHYVPVFAPQAHGDTAAAGAEAGAAADQVPARPPTGADRSATAARPWLLAALALALAALMALRWWPWPADAPGAAAPAAAPHTIAVLPFVDMSPDRELEYLADGLAEELIHTLAQSPSLQVTARTSAFTFKGGRTDIPTIADTLGVQYVIEGSVRRHDDRMRVTVQLIDTARNAHVWSNVYDSTRAQAFEVQTDIAEAVATSLRVVLAGDRDERHAHVPDPEAHARLLQARLLMNRRGPGELARAGELLRSAVELDPGYARAWAALGSVLYLRTMGGDLQPWESGMQSMIEAIDRALALDPDLAEAHIRRGSYLAWVHGDREGAVSHMRLAMAREPNNPLGLTIIAGKLRDRGQYEESLALQRHALASDPLNLVNRNNLAATLIATGDLPAAEVEIERMLELDPRSMRAQFLRAELLNLQGRADESLRVLQALPDSPERGYHMALAHARLGRAAQAEAALARLEARSTLTNRRWHPRVARAEMLVLLGRHEQAERLLYSAPRPDTRTPDGKREHHALGSALYSPYLHPLRESPGWENWSHMMFGERAPLELDTLLPAQVRHAITSRHAQSWPSSR